jgi:hypothetical protein
LIIIVKISPQDSLIDLGREKVGLSEDLIGSMKGYVTPIPEFTSASNKISPISVYDLREVKYLEDLDFVLSVWEPTVAVCF